MKIDLTLAVVKRLRLEELPVGVDAKGRLQVVPNSSLKPYIVWDSTREAPPGFGIKVAGKKTYIVRRKVHGKSIMPTVGNVADFNELSMARAKAADLARQMTESGANPNFTARMASAADLTLGNALSRYREHLSKRTQRPAKPETLRVVDKTVRRFEGFGWLNRRVRELPPDEIERKFLEKNASPASNEQAFRWATTAVDWCIGMEALAASVRGSDAAPAVNPFAILKLNKLFRSRAQIERERTEKGKRNPLGPSTSLGSFLEAAWSKKDINDAETGVHYLILMLLWGCRAAEHAKCRWGEFLTAVGPEGKGKLTTSHVALDDAQYGPYVFFHQTKNGLNHRLPIAPMALELLRRRQASAANEVVRRGFGGKSREFVFPARSRFSKSGHYSNATDLLNRIREEAGIERLTRHDLRRSFGAVMTALDVPETIKRRFFNHADTHVTDTYSKAEWDLLRTHMERIEQAILSTAPNVFNSLKPLERAPMVAPDPHVCQPPKSRSGRPRKIS